MWIAWINESWLYQRGNTDIIHVKNCYNSLMIITFARANCSFICKAASKRVKAACHQIYTHERRVQWQQRKSDITTALSYHRIFSQMSLANTMMMFCFALCTFHIPFIVHWAAPRALPCLFVKIFLDRLNCVCVCIPWLQRPIFIIFSDLIRRGACTRARWTFIILLYIFTCWLSRSLFFFILNNVHLFCHTEKVWVCVLNVVLQIFVAPNSCFDQKQKCAIDFDRATQIHTMPARNLSVKQFVKANIHLKTKQQHEKKWAKQNKAKMKQRKKFTRS